MSPFACHNRSSLHLDLTPQLQASRKPYICQLLNSELQVIFTLLWFVFHLDGTPIMERSDVSVIKKSKKALNRQTTIYKIPAQLLMLLCLCETYLDC